MGWPTDPVRKAQALENFAAAQRRRWENSEERARFSERATAQWTPEKRAAMAEFKREQYAKDPDLRERVAINLRVVGRRYTPERMRVLQEANRRKRTAKAARMDLIRASAAKLRNGATQANGV